MKVAQHFSAGKSLGNAESPCKRTAETSIKMACRWEIPQPPASRGEFLSRSVPSTQVLGYFHASASRILLLLLFAQSQPVHLPHYRRVVRLRKLTVCVTT